MKSENRNGSILPITRMMPTNSEIASRCLNEGHDSHDSQRQTFAAPLGAEKETAQTASPAAFEDVTTTKDAELKDVPRRDTPPTNVLPKNIPLDYHFFPTAWRLPEESGGRFDADLYAYLRRQASLVAEINFADGSRCCFYHADPLKAPDTLYSDASDHDNAPDHGNVSGEGDACYDTSGSAVRASNVASPFTSVKDGRAPSRRQTVQIWAEPTCPTPTSKKPSRHGSRADRASQGVGGNACFNTEQTASDACPLNNVKASERARAFNNAKLEELGRWLQQQIFHPPYEDYMPPRQRRSAVVGILAAIALRTAKSQEGLAQGCERGEKQSAAPTDK